MNKLLPGEEEGKECIKENMQHLRKPGGKREHGGLEEQDDVAFELNNVRERDNFKMVLLRETGPDHTVNHEEFRFYSQTWDIIEVFFVCLFFVCSFCFKEKKGLDLLGEQS